MTTKLTLSIDKKTVERAKRISTRRGKSISKMVEEYLNNIQEVEPPAESAMTKIRNAISRHKPALDIPENADYKKMIRDWRSEDYLKTADKKKKK